MLNKAPFIGFMVTIVMGSSVTTMAAADKIYITYEGGNYGVYQCNLDGTNWTDLAGVKNYCVPSGICIDSQHGKMYLAGVSPGEICSANLDGSGVKTITDHTSSPLGGVAVDPTAGYIYWTVHASSGVNNHFIKRANLDGTNCVTLLSSGFLNPEAIDLDLQHGKMYWTDYSAGNIQRADLDGSNLETLVTNIGIGWGIAVDPYHNTMYWTQSTGIWEANLNGMGQHQVLSLSSSHVPRSIDLDIARDSMYFTDWIGKSIWKANLDGTGLVQIPYNSSEIPYGIALDVAPVPEPSSFILCCFGVIGLLVLSWRLQK